MCGEKKYLREYNNKYLCLKCASNIFSDMDEYFCIQDRRIESTYEIDTTIKTVPIVDCNCQGSRVIPFNYFTKKLQDNMYILGLCCLCKTCGLYKEIFVPTEIFPIHIKDKPMCAGTNVNFPELETTDNSGRLYA